MPRGTTLRNFRCDDERWSDFLAACEAEGTDASKQIRDMIDVWMDGNGYAPASDSFLWPKDKRK